MSNLDIWNTLGRTDPAHTKGFQRAGGFRGTAIKPIYTEMKMTEQFGPCGIGWGCTEPHFQLVNGPEGEVAVYCWLSLWIRQDGEVSSPIPGVGGDFVVKKNKYGLTVDDEAFKKAMTDALGNSMKRLGMSADVHMGRFDDNKYVEQMKREAAAEPEQPHPERMSAYRAKGFGKNPIARPIIDEFRQEIEECETALAVNNRANYYREKEFPKWPNKGWVTEAEECIAYKLASFSAGPALAETLQDSVDTETGEITAAPTTRAEYVQFFQDYIARETDPQALVKAWKADATTRRRFSMREDESDALKERVGARIDELTEAPHGRDLAGRPLNEVADAG